MKFASPFPMKHSAISGSLPKFSLHYTGSARPNASSTSEVWFGFCPRSTRSK